MKGIPEVDRIINQFLAPFGASARLGNDFCYVPGKDLIIYSFLVSETNRQEFLESIETWEPAVEADIFLWSLLHELGHNETMNSLTDKDYEITERINKKIQDSKSARFDYYYTPVEKAATMWAVEYAETHIEELAKFWAELQPAILNFYKLNNISE